MSWLKLSISFDMSVCPCTSRLFSSHLWLICIPLLISVYVSFLYRFCYYYFLISKNMSNGKYGPGTLPDTRDKRVSKSGKNSCRPGTYVQVGGDRREMHKPLKYVVCSEVLNAMEKNKAGQEERECCVWGNIASALQCYPSKGWWRLEPVREMVKGGWNLDKLQQALKKARDRAIQISGRGEF